LKTILNNKVLLDPTAWLDQHGDYLFRYALIRVRDSAIAEDLLQETLLAAISSSQTFLGRSSERTWLVGIMKHKVVDYFRRVAGTAQFQLSPGSATDEPDCFEAAGPWSGHWREDEAPLNWPVDTANLLESREFWETFYRCLSQLPQQMAIAFTLREIDGLSSTEICEILKITPNNLWVTLHRSRAKLRHLLQTEWFSYRAAAA
jgi:RNA polymerase sigma-70 factor, ECF subfamily